MSARRSARRGYASRPVCQLDPKHFGVSVVVILAKAPAKAPSVPAAEMPETDVDMKVWNSARRRREQRKRAAGRRAEKEAGREQAA